MIKQANPSHPIHDLIARRWSPYGFDQRPVSPEDLRSLFEAARWAPSSYNEQPWRFIVATGDEESEFTKAVDCLWEPNQAWARHAPVLVIGIVRETHARNGKPNAAAQHDLGLAAANLSLEATARGLCVHQMIGIHPDKVRETYGVPDDFRPLTALAIGYPGQPAELARDVLDRDTSPRERQPLSAFVYSGSWEQPAM